MDLPAYVFRGTTIGFKGNGTSVQYGITCTSRHPVKAFWFALECVQANRNTAVVYIAATGQLSNIESTANVLEEQEEEIAFFIPPQKFYPLCTGYVPWQDFQQVLQEMGRPANEIVGVDNLTRLCSETGSFSDLDVADLVRRLQQFIQPVNNQ